MKEMKRREIELLARICNEKKVPLKLAGEILKTSETFSYQNVSAGERNKAYLKLINYYFKKDS